jgi:hypothetical protein
MVSLILSITMEMLRFSMYFQDQIGSMVKHILRNTTVLLFVTDKKLVSQLNVISDWLSKHNECWNCNIFQDFTYHTSHNIAVCMSQELEKLVSPHQWPFCLCPACSQRTIFTKQTYLFLHKSDFETKYAASWIDNYLSMSLIYYLQFMAFLISPLASLFQQYDLCSSKVTLFKWYNFHLQKFLPTYSVSPSTNILKMYPLCCASKCVNQITYMPVYQDYHTDRLHKSRTLFKQKRTKLKNLSEFLLEIKTFINNVLSKVTNVLLITWAPE